VSDGEPARPESGGAAAPARRARVLVLIKGLGLGGAERLVVDLMAHRDREHFDYEVASVLAGHDELAPALAEAGVAVHRLGARASTDLRWVARLRRLLHAGGYDVVHSHLPYAASFARLAVLSLPPGRRPALVYTEHSLWNKAAVLTRALNRATVGLDRALIVVSPAARDALPPSLRAQAQVVVHGVDRTRMAELVERRPALAARLRHEGGVCDDAPDTVVAITVANVRAEKGYAVWLEAARRLASRHVPVSLVSVGAGPELPELEAARDQAGLAGRVTFLGQRSDALELMTGADLFVLPSTQEGMPVALMEAMSLGVPVVASDIGGVPDIVDPGVEGVLVSPGDPAALADAIEELAAAPDRRRTMGAAARARSSQFDVSRSARTVEATYRRVLGPAPLGEGDR
jgi:glycosyltransferase involved in cell wall biosynthesis